MGHQATAHMYLTLLIFVALIILFRILIHYGLTKVIISMSINVICNCKSIYMIRIIRFVLNLYKLIMDAILLSYKKQSVEYLNEREFLLINKHKYKTLFSLSYVIKNKLHYKLKLNAVLGKLKIPVHGSKIIIQPLYLLPSKFNNITKQFIRQSRFFNKTKYSFIRQECKNIVHMTLLMNIILIISVLNIYMHFTFLINIVHVLIVFYCIAYHSYLFKAFSICKKFINIVYNFILNL